MSIVIAEAGCDASLWREMTINVNPRVQPICIFCIHYLSPLNSHSYSLVKKLGHPGKGIGVYIPPGIQHNISMRIRMLLVQLVVGTIILSFLINLSAPDAYDFLKQQISSALWRNILVLGLVVGALFVYAGIEVREKKNKKRHVFVRRLCRVQKIQTTPKKRMTKKNASDCNCRAPRARSATACSQEVTRCLDPQGPVGTVHEEADTETLHPNGLLHVLLPVHLSTTAATARGDDTEGLHPEGSVGPLLHEDADNEDLHPNGTPRRGKSDTAGLHAVDTVHNVADTEALHPNGKASSGRVESDTKGLHSVYPVNRNRAVATEEDTEGSHPESPVGTVNKEADKGALHSNGTACRGQAGELYTEDLHPEITVVIEPGEVAEHLRRHEGTVATVSGEEPESSHLGEYLRSSPAAELEMVASTLAREVFGQYSIERRWQDSVSGSLPSLPRPARQISPPRGWRSMGILRFLQRTRTSASPAPSVALVRVDFMAITIPTNQPVPGVEAASESDLTLTGSKVVYKWLDIGPQNASDELEKLKLQIIKSMSEAREIDEDSNLQIGSFAVLKYTDTGPKWWRLQGQSIPTISSVHRHPWSLLDLLYGVHAKWSIRGFNLQDSQLKVSTVDEKEDLNTLHYEKMVSAQEVLLCEESHLIRKFALWFQKDVYIYATTSLEVEKGVKVFVQSKPKDHVKRAYWVSVVQGLVPNVWAIIIMASVSLTNISNADLHIEGTRFSSLVLGKLYSFLVYVFSYIILIFVLTLWRLTHGGLRPTGDNVPSLQTCVPFEVLNSPRSPTSLLHEEDKSLSTVLNEKVEEEEGDDAPGRQTATASEFVDDNDSTITSLQHHKDDVNIEDEKREKVTEDSDWVSFWKEEEAEGSPLKNVDTKDKQQEEDVNATPEAEQWSPNSTHSSYFDSEDPTRTSSTSMTVSEEYKPRYKPKSITIAELKADVNATPEAHHWSPHSTHSSYFSSEDATGSSTSSWLSPFSPYKPKSMDASPSTEAGSPYSSIPQSEIIGGGNVPSAGEKKERSSEVILSPTDSDKDSVLSTDHLKLNWQSNYGSPATLPNSSPLQDPESIGRAPDDAPNEQGPEDRGLSKALNSRFNFRKSKHVGANHPLRKVVVNGIPIPDHVVKEAEDQVGPIHPGTYWYDVQAGFWGVAGGQCLGIIPPFIQAFNYPMTRDCAAGRTGIFVNGRELHDTDREKLCRRGLPETPGMSYRIQCSGRVIEEATGLELKGLGQLAPSREKSGRRTGMRVPSSISGERS